MQINTEGLNNLKGRARDAQNSIKSAVNIISGIKIPSDFNGAGEISSVQSFLSSIGNIIGNITTWIDSCVNKFNSVQNKNNEILNVIGDTFLKVGASAANVGVSGAKGVLHLGEYLTDAWAILLTGVETTTFGASDVATWAFNNVRGKDTKFEWKNTKSAWSRTMSFVSNDYVGSAYNKFYNTKVGKSLASKAYKPFKPNQVVTNMTSGIAEIAGTAAISLITAGVGGIAVGSSASIGISAGVAGSAGLGKYTKEGWNKLANEQISFGKRTAKSISYGVINGAWEGAQWFFGGKLGSFAIKGSKAASAAIRVAIDSSVNAADTPVRAFSESLLTGKGFKKAWKEQGGWTSLLTNLGIGLVGSAFGEAVSFGKKQANVKQEEIYEQIKISKTEMKKYFKEHPNYGISEMELENVFKHIKTFDTQEAFENYAVRHGYYTKEQLKHIGGYNYGGTSFLRPNNKFDTVTHEAIHSLGWLYNLDGYGHKQLRGINEAVTEMLARKIHGLKGEGSTGYSSNVRIMLKLNEMLKNIQLGDVIPESYYKKEPKQLEMLLNGIAEREDFFKEFAEATSIADGWHPTIKDKKSILNAQIKLYGMLNELDKKIKQNY